MTAPPLSFNRRALRAGSGSPAVDIPQFPRLGVSEHEQDLPVRLTRQEYLGWLLVGMAALVCFLLCCLAPECSRLYPSLQSRTGTDVQAVLRVCAGEIAGARTALPAVCLFIAATGFLVQIPRFSPLRRRIAGLLDACSDDRLELLLAACVLGAAGTALVLFLIPLCIA